MQFYHWDWEYIMGLNLRLFWTLVKNMHRIKAADNLRMIRITCFPNLAEDVKREYIAAQDNTLGVLVVSAERDVEGLDKLRNL